jgi:hypothetical protein
MKNENCANQASGATYTRTRALSEYQRPQLIRVGAAVELLQATPEGGFTDSINQKRRAQASTKKTKKTSKKH